MVVTNRWAGACHEQKQTTSNIHIEMRGTKTDVVGVGGGGSGPSCHKTKTCQPCKSSSCLRF